VADNWRDRNEPSVGPPSRAAVARIIKHAHEIHLCPGELHAEAEQRVARALRVDDDEVLLTDGADEATDLALLHARRGTCVTPGFAGYRDRARALSVPMSEVPLASDGEIDDGWAGEQGGALLVAQPGTPAGRRFRRPWLRAAAERFDVVVVDETYLPYAWPPARSARALALANVATFMSFSLAHGLAGLRIGALIGPAALMGALRVRKSLNNVDSLSLHGLVGALTDVRGLQRAVLGVRRMRAFYIAALRSATHVIAEARNTECNFVLARPVATRSPDQLLTALSARGVDVVDCAPLGLPGWLRITVGDEHGLELLTRALDELQHEG
jgi:histidinol-phosphate aminotransferase